MDKLSIFSWFGFPIPMAEQSDRLGFCYDSGHEKCYTKGTDFLSQYGSKLMALHLHDNDGVDDRHWIPGEGSIDWREKVCFSDYSFGFPIEKKSHYRKL